MLIDVTEHIVRAVYQLRPLDAKKYDYGHLLVIGGSAHYTGAPQLVALAAMRAGCDLATLIAPKRAADAAASANSNFVTRPLIGDFFTSDHVQEILTCSKGKSALVLGNGLGREEATLHAVRQLLQDCSLPAVVDADAIRAVGEHFHDVVKGKPFVFTPHAHEFLLLSGIDLFHKTFEERMEAVRDTAQKLGCVVALKGNKDIISDGQEVAVNSTGTPFMTKGGTGDVLAGIIGALLARGIAPFIAAQAGCFLSGKAGERASAQKGEGLLATDVIEMIPNVLIQIFG